MSDSCKYPGIKVQLIGNDGNAFSVLGQVKKALKNGGVSLEEVTEFYDDATSGDYNHLLQVVMSWVEVTSADEEDEDDEDENEDDDDEDDELCPDCGEMIDFCVCNDEDDGYGYGEQRNFD